MKPEDKAREDIDRQLTESGWEVQDHRSMNLFPRGVDAELNAIAVREFPVTKPGGAKGLSPSLAARRVLRHHVGT